MKTKVVHIITGLNDGGAEAVLYRLCMSEQHCDHIVVSLMDEGKYGPLLETQKINVYCMNLHESKFPILSLFRLFKFLRNIKPDIVQTWMYHADFIGGIIAKLSLVKNIFWGVHHSNLDKDSSKFLTILICKINSFLSKFIPKKIIYCAEKSRLIHEKIGFAINKGVVIPNGYDIDDFKPNDVHRKSFRDELSLFTDSFLIGHVGRFHHYKDYPNFFGALSMLKGHKKLDVVLVGSHLDEKNDCLCSMINNFSPSQNIRLLGRREDIPVVMNGFDLFILSSSSEAFPNVLNEAMASGIPCITTDVGDASFIVGDTGWVVPHKDPKSLAFAISQAIQEKLTNPNAWSKRKLACRSRIVYKFSIDKMVESYKYTWGIISG